MPVYDVSRSLVIAAVNRRGLSALPATRPGAQAGDGLLEPGFIP